MIAVGAEQNVPDVPGIDKSHVASAIEVLRDESKYKGSRAVVIGGGDVGCETACHLADNDWEVTIVEILQKLLEENIMTNVKVQMFSLLEEKNVKIMTDTKLNAVTDDGVEVILPNGKQWGVDADLITIAIGFKAEGGVTPSEIMQVPTLKGQAAALAMQCDEVHIIGDCHKPAAIREATEDGERIGRWL